MKTECLHENMVSVEQVTVGYLMRRQKDGSYRWEGQDDCEYESKGDAPIEVICQDCGLVIPAEEFNYENVGQGER